MPRRHLGRGGVIDPFILNPGLWYPFSRKLGGTQSWTEKSLAAAGTGAALSL
jgi:hypothetical protein